MDIERIYALILIGAGVLGLRSAIMGESIEKSDDPKLSKTASRIIYALTGLVLIFFGVLRLQ